MSNWIYFIYFIVLVILYEIYFVVASRFQIVDTPNHRTMHQGSTIRGGGVVVALAINSCSLVLDTPGLMFSVGLFLVTAIGFLDDIMDLSLKIRFPVQVISIIIVLAELSIFNTSTVYILVILIVATGVLNAFNFMDGINGMTGGYSSIILISLLFVNNFIQEFVPNSFLFFSISAIMVFNIYNFRNKAICFAGDVGSLSVAFLIIYLILKLIQETQQVAYLLFLTLYGIDTIFTIIQRLANRENIFEAHRKHLFQLIVARTGMPHLYMSIIYMFVQAIINFGIIMIIHLSAKMQMAYAGVMLVFLSTVYIAIKKRYLTNSA